MKWIIIFIAVTFGLTAPPWAQGNSPDACEQCVCLADNTCSGESCGFGDAGCRSLTFTALCSGSYTLKWVLKCDDNSNCQHCLSCVGLFDRNGGVVGSAHGPCQPDVCEGTAVTGTLTYGQQYTLKVCLQSCGAEGCERCSSCTAYGYAYAFGCGPSANCAP